MKQYRAITLAMLGICFMATVSPLAGWAKMPETVFQQASQLYHQGDYSHACNRFSALMEQYPEDSRAAYFLAISLVKTGQIRQASDLYKTIRLLYPNETAAQLAQKGLGLIKATGPVSSVEKIAPPSRPVLKPFYPLKPSEQLSQQSTFPDTLEASSGSSLDSSASPIRGEGPTGGITPGQSQPEGVFPQREGLEKVAEKPADSLPSLAPSKSNNASAVPGATHGTVTPELMQQMMMMQMMGSMAGGGGGNASGTNAWLPMMMMQQQMIPGNNPQGQGSSAMPAGVDPALMSQMLMQSMMGNLEFGKPNKDD